MWHTVLELMFRSVQLHSTQLSLTATFQSCGLWHLVECCSQYKIQRCAAFDTAFRCISSKMSFKSFESGIKKKMRAQVLAMMGPYSHTWAFLGTSKYVTVNEWLHDWAGVVAQLGGVSHDSIAWLHTHIHNWAGVAACVTGHG